MKRKEAVKVDDFSIYISTAEDLALLKLLSSREQDRLDAEKIFEMQKANLDIKYIQKWSKKLGINISFL